MCWAHGMTAETMSRKSKRCTQKRMRMTDNDDAMMMIKWISVLHATIFIPRFTWHQSQFYMESFSVFHGPIWMASAGLFRVRTVRELNWMANEEPFEYIYRNQSAFHAQIWPQYVCQPNFFIVSFDWRKSLKCALRTTYHLWPCEWVYSQSKRVQYNRLTAPGPAPLTLFEREQRTLSHRAFEFLILFWKWHTFSGVSETHAESHRNRGVQEQQRWKKRPNKATGSSRFHFVWWAFSPFHSHRVWKTKRNNASAVVCVCAR